MRAAVSLPVTAKNIGQLGARLSCRPPMSERQHRPRRLSVRESQKVKRTPRGDKLVLADLQITLGTLKRVVPQQRLNCHKIRPAF